MIDTTQCFVCGLFFIGVWGFFLPKSSMIRWLMAIELLILVATTELLIAGYSGHTAPSSHIIALFWMTFAAVELAVGLAFVRRLADEGLSLKVAEKTEIKQED